MTTHLRHTAVLTAGGTREPIDDVRHIRNVATGSLPAAMATCLLARGWEVHYLHGPGAVLPGELHRRWSLLQAGDGLDVELARLARHIQSQRARLAHGRLVLVPVTSAADADARMKALLADVQPDLVACAMAVADWAPRPLLGKLSSQPEQPGAPLPLLLYPTPKLIDGVRQVSPGAKLLGFKLLSGSSEAQHVAAAAHLAARSGADLVFGNDMADYRLGRRRGVLRGPDGAPLLALEGGEGEGANERLAEALVDAALERFGLS